MLFLYLTLLFVFQLYKRTITKSRWRSVRKQNQVMIPKRLHVTRYNDPCYYSFKLSRRFWLAPSIRWKIYLETNFKPFAPSLSLYMWTMRCFLSFQWRIFFFFLRNRRKLFLSTVIKTRQNFKRYTVPLFVAYNKNQ